MPDEKDPLKAAAAAGPEIHVIPEKFYGAALKQKVGKLPPPPADPKTPPPPTPPLTLVPPGGKPKKKFPILAVVIPIILMMGGAGAYFLFFKPKPVAVTQPPVNAAPKGPVCGDGTCDPSESTANCSADCKPPAPVCGDTKCEAPSETIESCATDCKPAAPVCGDTKCEAPTETIESCAKDCKPPEAVPGADSDSDGLTDEEEKTVFGTNPNNPNSDSDTFVDLNEALNLFNPAKPSPSMLVDNPGFALFRDEALGFDMLRPAGWTAKNGATEDAAVTFTAQSGEFIVASVVATRTEGQSLMDWYLAQSPGATSSQVEPYRTRQGYEAISSPDRFTTYVDGGDKVIVITYNLGPRAEVQYKITFQAMIQSLHILKK